MRIPFVKRCSRTAWFRVEAFDEAEDKRPGLVGKIEAAVASAGGHPEGANTPKGLFWVCLDESSLTVEQVGELLKSFRLTVHYLGENYDHDHHPR